MDSEYDRKFEDMKKYIPFLESMIKRLETTSTSSANPRQAQLDKIRSLRDLLLDKKKRMKMENLLKCEQVLVNLYAKVEQRDTLPSINKASDKIFPSASSKQDLNSSRSKSNTTEPKTTVVVEDPDTLPEIARACETEVVCTPGSKEPALFQRRPNKKSISPSRASQSQHNEKKSPQKSVPKRNYTRVLVSPEPSSERWPSTERTTTDKPLFTRRSPQKPSPSYSKKEKKKSSKNKPLPKDLNITLNVPEESLNSLNTGDILSRIIKCPDNDVDIDTLRDLRQQILGELKQTGASEDISDLILNSYKQKKKKKKPQSKKDEVEEGELSDSESEAIASVYGSLVVVNKDESSTGQTKIPEKEKQQQRKIQICLVINSDKENASTDQTNETARLTDASDFEMFDDILPAKTEEIPKVKGKEQKTNNKKLNEKNASIPKIQDVITIDDDDVNKDTKKTIELEAKSSDSSLIDISSPEEDMGSPKSVEKRDSETAAPFRANFYKPLSEPEDLVKHRNQLETGNDNSKQNTITADTKSKELLTSKEPEEENGNLSRETSNSNKSGPTENKELNSEKTDSNDKKSNVNTNTKEPDDVPKSTEETVEIPLLNLEPTVPAPPKKDNVSEIEILQALKNEILSESIAIPSAEVTPALHQPKVTKVASAKEVTKKRISIEKYKQKSAPTTKTSLFINDPNYSRYSDQSKKHSLKLTDEELERFNFPAKLALHDSSEEDEEDKAESPYSLDDIYADLAPKSPETTEEASTEKNAPKIIPVDPVTPVIVSSKADVDMRTIIPTISPNVQHHQSVPSTVLPSSEVKIVPKACNEKKLEPKRPVLVDPRIRRDLNKSANKESPNPHAIQERTPRPIGAFPNMTPNLAPNLTPNSRAFEMTPSRQSFDGDDNNSRKHVYAPFPTVDSRWESNSDFPKEGRNNRWEPWMDVDVSSEGSQSRKWEDRDRRGGSVRDNSKDYQKSRYDTEAKHKSSRYSQDQGDAYSRIDCPRTPVHPFGRSDCPLTPTPSFGRLDVPINPFTMAECPPTPGHPFGMSDFPMTPSHPFGRNDAPMTPSHPFGRTDAPMTPNHPFGRSDMPIAPFGLMDAPMTPSHPFGRTDAPMTPSHPFGRSEAPMTPSHPFGRSEAPMTPSHPFGRSDSAPMTPSHPFGRSDYTHNQHIPGPRKDPRLNRSGDYDSGSRNHDDNRDRGYNDRRKSDNRSYNNDSCYGREQSVGRNDRNLYDRRNNIDTTRGHERRGRERSRGRSVTRDYEPENLYPGDRSGDRAKDYYHDVETETRRGYQRAPSVGRSRPEERFCRSSSRAPSIERNYEREVSNDNTLSVKPQSGRSFTIDTSVNTTFQEFLKGKGLQVSDSSFDSRRQRAASVGRSLTREPSIGRNFREGSVGRTLTKPTRLVDEDTSGYKNMVHFVRARSMGRDLTDKPEKSFKDIKAEFESYRSNSKPKQINPNNNPKGNLPNHGNRKKDLNELQQGKTAASISSGKKKAYSPRKNYRDPRMRNDNYNNKNKNRHQDNTKNFGIVYTHDNITKGTILGSGYGVKNYKIPKIKRPVEEQVVKEQQQKDSKINEKKSNVIEKEKETKVRKETENKKVKEVGSKTKPITKKGKGKDIVIVEDKKQNIVSKSKQARKTKVSGWSDKIEPETSTPVEATVRTRRTKKAVIDSDSDSEPITKNKDTVKVDVSRTSNKNDLSKSNPTTNEEEDKYILDTSFGMDEIFSENITSDPVMANINALIADLDNDIDTTKTEDLGSVFRDISFNSLLESISTPSDKQATLEQSLNDISEVIDTDSRNLSHEKEKELAGQAEKQTNETPENISKDPVTLVKETVESELNNIFDTNNKLFAKETCDNSKNENKVDVVTNEAIVSTTETEKELVGQGEEQTNETPENIQEPAKKLEEVNADRCSTPDSTINTNEVVHNQSGGDEGLPDSTNEKSDMQTDVTSTHDQSEPSEQYTSKETEPISIGNLLSMLKDKSTTKKLLSMLGDESEENQKIKKKLEKLLSESDDEDTNDGIKDDSIEKGEEIINEENNTSEEKVKENITEDENQKEIQGILVNETQAVKEAESSIKATEHLKELSGETDTTTFDNTEQITDDDQSPNLDKPRKVTPKKNRKGKSKPVRKAAISEERRVTRSGVAISRIEKPKKPSRELRQLHESIKEMFMSDDILNATGIRMCRLAKLADDKNRPEEDNTSTSEPKPVVVLEKINEKESPEDAPKTRKKPGPKPKPKTPIPETSTKSDSVPKEIKTSLTSKYRPGPKSKTKIPQEESDPYSFDDSVSEATIGQTSLHTSSDSDDDSLASSKSFGSSEVLADIKKKPKRKRRPGWQSGVIKSSKRRKKSEAKQADSSFDDCPLMPQKPLTIPDMNCFTDKSYCFFKNNPSYYCRLCEYSGTDIVKHYKNDHPHSEIPLSRMNPVVAREAIDECEGVHFQAISKMSTEKYVCRFCFEEFSNKRAVLEEFFWHVVSMHTGEYKRLCSECINVTRCPFNLDIPPPPKDVKGQLIGYICGKCNFTQISLENLKIHVIVRHNDEQTAVYTINLAAIGKKTMKTLLKRCQDQPRVLRSLRSNPNTNETENQSDHSNAIENDFSDTDSKATSAKDIDSLPIVSVQTKLEFESDDNMNDEENNDSSTVKVERNDNETENQEFNEHLSDTHQPASTDILDYPHFKISYKDSGTKEYVCCINGTDNHYKTSLLISMKRHVQTKHSEIWDGYCFICKVIVTPQGQHLFKECLQHLLDKHMDNLPVLKQKEIDDRSETTVDQTKSPEPTTPVNERIDSPKPYINVRPLSDLLSTADNSVALPKIESVISLGAGADEASPPPQRRTSVAETDQDEATMSFKTPNLPPKATPAHALVPEEIVKYEEVQAEVMSKKHRVIIDAMMTHEKLIQIYKCAGRFCSFTTDSADAAVFHASTHQRIGGENSLICAYCEFDCRGNAIDLVMHVFKAHGRCQYVCGHCFYRACASQLVVAHISRIHGETASQIVLETTTVTPVNEDPSLNVLPRETAVQHYVCNNLDGTCKFKTYMPGKFIDHLSKHAATNYTCYICSEEVQNPNELLYHMKNHGMKLYQCTWCIDGGDNEAEFMAHSSARHPSREPQAYLRITTNNQKGGATKTMVLPLVKLNNSNKSSILTRLVTPNANVEDPAKEAERAIDLEKIITSMPLLLNEATKKPQTPPIPATTCEVPLVSTPIEETLEPEIPLGPQILSTSPHSEQLDEPTVSVLTHVIKKEPLPENPTKNLSASEVICLDSDEEDSIDSSDSREKAIDLSEENQSSNSNATTQTKPQPTKLPPLALFKCQNCTTTCRNLAGFKRHIAACFSGLGTYRCAHCPLITTKDINSLCLHYNTEHSQDSQSKLPHVCGVCQRTDTRKLNIKYHMKKDHGASNLVTTVKFEGHKPIGYLYTIAEQRQLPKRKQSFSSSTSTPPKRTRYGPQDLDKLPQKPILDDLTYCSECEFSTKVRLNLVRHFQQHAEAQTVPQTAPVNPVPHLETNERHFDKMVNLASSSLETILRSDKPPPAVTFHMPVEAASRFPKYVPDKHRYTCGAKGCSYISVDEAMFKCHWDTLHNNSSDYHCVHCPPSQYLDTSKPLIAARILAHLKMHDARLYACSSCTYYHYKKHLLDKHLAEVHKGSGEVRVVREEFTNQSPVSLSQPSNAAPTMDFKLWLCGLCDFKSMSRRVVVEHCCKAHSTKMQYKCPVCPFRASTLENVTKHKSNAHPGNTEEVFYYYYIEGSVPDEPDGTPRWVKQRQKMGNLEPEVKTETQDTSQQTPTPLAPILPTSTRVDLDIVKKEVVDLEFEETMEDLCKHFGEICDPNGLKYKCPLCKIVMEDGKDAMQSHLYEELQYRKWGCSICSYKAFHKTGLHEHVLTEHAQKRQIDPIELQADTRVERWVSHVLDHQSAVIESNKTNLVRQKIQMEKPSTSTAPTPPKETVLPPTKKPKEKDIENVVQAFGPLGSSNDANFCCPKCDFYTADEGLMKDHLETELNKIRWRCSGCCEHSQNYHEAQLHSKTCKSSQPGQASRPVEADRDPATRAAWLAAVISTQKLTINQAPAAIQTPRSSTDESTQSKADNSLLVVRYEEEVQTPEEQMLSNRKRPATAVSSPDSDDERLVIDEETLKKVKTCPHCEFASKYQQAVELHLLRHWNLRQYTCSYCEVTLSKTSIASHNVQYHPGMPERYRRTRIPNTPPTVLELANKKGKRGGSVSQEDIKNKEVVKEATTRVVCLVCEDAILETEMDKHKHHGVPTYFARKGDVVVKCCNCFSLLPNVNTLKEHHTEKHPNIQVNYSYFKLNQDSKEIFVCGHCNKYFKRIKDIKAHHSVYHSLQQLKYETKIVVTHDECDSEGGEMSRNTINESVNLQAPTVRKVARKSTTKLPTQTVARKSTTKLPFFFYPEESEEEYSFYGTKPTPLEDLDNVTTIMPFCNTMMSFTMNKLSELIKIDPIVLVKDCKK